MTDPISWLPLACIAALCICVALLMRSAGEPLPLPDEADPEEDEPTVEITVEVLDGKFVPPPTFTVSRRSSPPAQQG